MSIASGISTPTVYILDESGINAFAAGLTLDDAVIGVTRGCVEKLDREELQGVIAHEFSHIFNGDMRLNLQLTATLHGILLIGLIGQFLLRSMMRTNYQSRYYSTDKKGRGGGPYLLILGVGLVVIGYVGTFFGSVIKAGVSRKREYLADATAVQYTRYPQGISGALKKIAYYSSELHAPDVLKR
jgi:Zn-dependent protease with chaperone function